MKAFNAWGGSSRARGQPVLLPFEEIYDLVKRDLVTENLITIWRVNGRHWPIANVKASRTLLCKTHHTTRDKTGLRNDYIDCVGKPRGIVIHNGYGR